MQGAATSAMPARIVKNDSVIWVPPNGPALDVGRAELAARVFLDVNGMRSLPPPDALERMTPAVAAVEASKDDLIAWVRARLG